MANNFFSTDDGPSLKDATVKGVNYIIGRVKYVVLGPTNFQGTRDPEYQSPRDIGKIRFEMLYSGMNLSNADGAVTPAYPLLGNIKQFPLLHEIVLIVPGPSPELNESIDKQSLYYFPPFSLWNSPQHNAFPNLLEWGEYLKNIGMGGSADNMVALPVGKTFEEKKDIRSLRPFEGDLIIESRFGSSIRFGSTVVATQRLNTWSESGRNGAPITIIRNGQAKQPSNDYFDTMVEDVNKEPSSIWLTNGQNLYFSDIHKYPLGSYKAIKRVKQIVKGVDRLLSDQEIESAAGIDRIIIPSTISSGGEI